jgi:TonB family protein
MTRLPVRRSALLEVLTLLTAGLLCSCGTSRIAFEGNSMPEDQVNTYLQVVSPKGAYDTPPSFRRGFAPFFPEAEVRKRHWGYALAEFTVATDGGVDNIRMLKATAAGFAEEADYALQDWRFEPAKKNGQPVAVKARLPFTFRTHAGDTLATKPRQ